MQKKALKLDQQAITHATLIANHRIKSAVDLGRKMADDPEADARQAKGLCIACYYPTRLAGQAFTMQPCAACHEPQTYSSTNTDALCLPCAKERELCKHCGGALNQIKPSLD